MERVIVNARLLGRELCSEDLFLLALTELAEEQPARRALARVGIDRERLLAHIRVSGDRPFDAPRSLTFAPGSYVLQGRTEGFAATLGDGTITPEQVLLALIWDPTSPASQLLWRLGVQRERIVAGLRRLGVPVPTARLPAQRTIEYGERVWFDRQQVSHVINHLRLHIPPETKWGFNYADDRAWVHAEADIDVEALVQAALARPHP